MKNERLLSLRNQMKEAGVHCMVIPTSDYHNSEYVSDFFMARKYFSGFTGSAGTLVVTPDEAALFTDGRYFIQAAKELKDSGITLMKMGEPEVPTMTEYVDQKLQQGWTLCFDGRVLTSSREVSLKKLSGSMEDSSALTLICVMRHGKTVRRSFIIRSLFFPKNMPERAWKRNSQEYVRR